MNTDQDAETVHILTCFRERLTQLIQVDPLLDVLHFLAADRKERVRAKLRAEGNTAAAAFLIEDLIGRQNDKGWSRVLINGLGTVGCLQAAHYVENKPPNPAEEEENDTFVRFIDLMRLSLIEMKTSDVCCQCYSAKILTAEDKENINKEVDNKGSTAGARLLLERLVKKDLGWFSKFLKVLEDTEHHNLVRELKGITCDTNEEKPACSADSEHVSPPEPHKSAEEVDIYNAEDSTEDLDQSGSEMVITLRDYQMEVARPALEDKNIIICLPTGSGKTRVAVFITREHLRRKRQMGKPGKVVVLVNKIPLVEQHYRTEFGKFLQKEYSVERVSGASQLKISFPQIVEQNDIIICTAQILENSLARGKSGDEDGIQLSQFSLMVIDECHHTKKGDVYNHIMIRYLQEKHQNQILVKQQKPSLPVPQILGLTASPGVGGAKNLQQAEQHILQICAQLDAFTIKTSSLEGAKQPFKTIAKAEERKEDPFGDVIKHIMDEIHAHAELKPLCEPGTQNYEQWVVQTEQNAAKEENQKVRVCAEHLRQYNEALYQSNTIRMSDAFSFLKKYHEDEIKTKFSHEGEDNITVTDTERFLFRLFRENRAQLQDLMEKPEFENNSLAVLRTKILQEFSNRPEARGLIFTRTRLSAIALSQWIQSNSKFEDLGVKASYLIGGGDQSIVKPMTSAEQKDVLNKFHEGEINLLIATTVAEEGLDIAQCNFVVRYCVVTNEISMIQARGRGRAEDSSYTLVAATGSGVVEREMVNEFREKMMGKAIAKVCQMSRTEYDKKVKEFQMQAIIERKMKQKKKSFQELKKEPPSAIRLSCRQCSVSVCSGEDIEIMEQMHHVNTTEQFSQLFTKRENASLQERLLDQEINGVIACKNCGQQWGSMMLYKSIECPCLHVRNFVVTWREKKKTFSRWNELPISFPAFDYIQHAQLLLDEDEMEI